MLSILELKVKNTILDLDTFIAHAFNPREGLYTEENISLLTKKMNALNMLLPRLKNEKLAQTSLILLERGEKIQESILQHKK